MRIVIKRLRFQTEQHAGLGPLYHMQILLCLLKLSRYLHGKKVEVKQFLSEVLHFFGHGRSKKRFNVAIGNDSLSLTFGQEKPAV